MSDGIRILQGTPIPFEETPETVNNREETNESTPPEGLRAARGRNLNVPRVVQRADNWCWAACAEMMFRFSGVNPLPTQCALANKHKTAGGNINCCQNPRHRSCDFMMVPEVVFNAEEVFPNVVAPLAFSEVVNAIENVGFPIGVTLLIRINNRQTGHMVLISGYQQSSFNDVIVVDPSEGNIFGGQLRHTFLSRDWRETYLFS